MFVCRPCRRDGWEWKEGAMEGGGYANENDASLPCKLVGITCKHWGYSTRENIKI